MEDPTAVIKRALASEDYYAILGVERNATEAEIKKSYRNIARMTHPDKCQLPKCEDAFKKVGAAYKCLSNADSRRSYDVTGSEASEGGMGGGHPFNDEMFSQFFHQNGNSSAQSGFGGNGFQTNIAFPPFLAQIIEVVPWKIVLPVLIVAGIYFLFRFLFWILSLSFYIIPILYITPARVRWWLVLLVLILSYFQFI
jgi:hypothetical protein